LRVIADYSPITTMVAACRDLFGNPNPIAADAPWALHHAVVAAILWCAGISVVSLAVAVRRYGRAR
jgi:ABC-2 type transport system permease protein